MRNVSNEFKRVMEGRRDFYCTAEITFQDGTVRPLGKDDFALSGNQYVEGTGGIPFPIGIVATKQATVTINNYDDRWSAFDFQWAKIFLRLCLDLDGGGTESINMGHFTVITPESYGTTITITAMDDSYKLDREYDTDLPYPASLGTALWDSCHTCGVTLLTQSREALGRLPLGTAPMAAPSGHGHPGTLPTAGRLATGITSMSCMHSSPAYRLPQMTS